MVLVEGEERRERSETGSEVVELRSGVDRSMSSKVEANEQREE